MGLNPRTTAHPDPEEELTHKAKQAGRIAALAAAKAAVIKGSAAVIAKIGPLVLLTAILMFLVAIVAGILYTFVDMEPTPEYEDGIIWIATETGEKLKYYKLYQKYGEQYNVPWNLLAAIHKVETNFGQNLTESWAGAVGHTQFMPCAWLGWDHYASLGHCDRLGKYIGPPIDMTDPKNIINGEGVDANGDGKADPWDIDDALAATAMRLARDKEVTGKGWFDVGGPVWKYNPTQEYVNKVESYFDKYGKPVVAEGQRKVIGTGQLAIPTEAPFGCGWGCYSGHKGQDFPGPIGTPIYAADDGVVIKVEHLTHSYGSYIVIDHGNGLTTLYAHMWKHQVKVREGQRVRKGQQIGGIGNNGNSTGPHLHFEVRENGKPVNPLKYLKQ